MALTKRDKFVHCRLAFLIRALQVRQYGDIPSGPFLSRINVVSSCGDLQRQQIFCVFGSPPAASIRILRWSSL